MQRIFYLHVSARAFSGRWGSLRHPAGRSTDCSAFAFMYLCYYANYNSLLAIVRSAAAGTCKGGFRVLLRPALAAIAAHYLSFTLTR